jgi:hypothetical protein
MSNPNNRMPETEESGEFNSNKKREAQRQGVITAFDRIEPGEGVRGENLSPRLKYRPGDFPAPHDGVLAEVESAAVPGGSLPTSPSEVVGELLSPPGASAATKSAEDASPLESRLPMTVGHAEILRVAQSLARKGTTE